MADKKSNIESLSLSGIYGNYEIILEGPVSFNLILPEENEFYQKNDFKIRFSNQEE